jgi:hypothetical protein
MRFSKATTTKQINNGRQNGQRPTKCFFNGAVRCNPKFISSFKALCRGQDAASKAHHWRNTNVVHHLFGTMRILLTLLIFIHLDSCSNVGQIDINCIKIIKTNQHPFLRDHDRKLITVDKNQKTINESRIYSDSGDGCESYLFDSDSKYILVDCNGQWFSIDKLTGTIKNDGWKWNNKLPDNCLGKFQTTDNDSVYHYSRETNFQTNDVYKYKDPSWINGAQQNVCTMAGWRVSYKCYLRSTFAHADSGGFESPPLRKHKRCAQGGKAGSGDSDVFSLFSSVYRTNRKENKISPRAVVTFRGQVVPVDRFASRGQAAG